MPIYQLDERLIFPAPELADESGILAIGGDLSAERILLAYHNGIFPWYSKDDPIIWWSPDSRMVLYPDDLKVSRSMQQVLRKQTFKVTLDKDFPAVIQSCKKQPRKGQQGTWITPEMQEAYIKLHELGYAHSVEVWKDKQLAGGLYGVSLGRCFFGESMFTKVSNASKTGFIKLVRLLKKQGFPMIDCQVYTRHLASLGAKKVSREQYLKELEACLKEQTIRGDWGEQFKV